MPYTSPTWVNGASPAISASNLQQMSDTVAESQNWSLSCTTAAATATKTVSQSGFVLSTGMKVSVAFTYGNTASSPTMNIGGTGAYPLYSSRTGTYVTAPEMENGMVGLLSFNGSAWVLTNPITPHLEGTASLPASGWTDNTSSSGYYYRNVSISGILASDRPSVGISKSLTDADADAAMQEAWDLVAAANAQAGAIRFYVTELPTVAVTFQWAVNR